MREIIIYVLVWVFSWVLKGFVDWGIKRSKRTENTFDDWFFAKLKLIVTFISELLINKFKK